MKTKNLKRLEKLFNPNECTISTDFIVIDGHATKIKTTSPKLTENNVFPGTILFKNNSFIQVKIEADGHEEVVNVEL